MFIAAQNFGKGEPVLYYHGSILYRDLDCESTSAVYEEIEMDVSSQEFRTWAIELFQEKKYSDGRDHSFWLVPAKFKAMRYIDVPSAVLTVSGSDRRYVDCIMPLRTAFFLRKRLYRGSTLHSMALSLFR